MKRFKEQFNNQAKKITLSSTEKNSLRERIVSYVEYHPIPHRKAQVFDEKCLIKKKGFLHFFSLYWRRLAGVFSIFLFIFIPFMAERSLPGDILYAVKVGLNEEIRSSINRSPYKNIEWETERLNRRLNEIQVLVKEGKMTHDQEEKVAMAVQNHSDSARASIEKLRIQDEDEAAMAEIALNALLDVHTVVFLNQKRETYHIDDKNEVYPSEERRNMILTALENSRGQQDVFRDASGPTYEGLMRRIEVESGRAYELLLVVSDYASDDALISLNRHLEDVERKVQSGIETYEVGNETEARVILAEALTSIRRVISFVSSIELSKTVDINKILPIEYTAEELSDELRFRKEKLQVRYLYVLDKFNANATTSVSVKKFDALLSETPLRFASTSDAIKKDDFANAGFWLSKIEESIDDMILYLDIPDRLQDINLGTTTIDSRYDMSTSSLRFGTSTPGDMDLNTDKVAELELSTSTMATSSIATSSDQYTATTSVSDVQEVDY